MFSYRSKFFAMHIHKKKPFVDIGLILKRIYYADFAKFAAPTSFISPYPLNVTPLCDINYTLYICSLPL